MVSKNISEEVITRIFDQLDEIKKDIAQINVILAKQSVVLEDHTRRSLANENEIKLVEKQLVDEVSPIKTEMAKLTGMIKLVAGVITVVAVVAQVAQVVLQYMGAK